VTVGDALPAYEPPPEYVATMWFVATGKVVVVRDATPLLTGASPTSDPSALK
jgi:hypothetical protein